MTWTVPPRGWSWLGDGWTPPRHWPPASVHRWPEGKQISRALSGAVLATIRVKAGECNGLRLAHHTIAAVAQLSSVRARKQLTPLAQALAAWPGSDAAELTRMARQVATTQA